MKFTLSCSDGFGNAKNCRYPQIMEIASRNRLELAAGYDHTAALFENAYRSKANFVYSDVIVMDCDNDADPSEWVSIEDLEHLIGFDVSYAVVESRNHMKPKGTQSARPRFHVYFPIHPLENAEDYEKLKQKIYREFPFFDSNALDCSRFFYGVIDPKVVWHDSISTIDEVLEGPRQQIQEGSRNSTLSQFASKILKRYGISKEAQKAFKEEAAKCSPPLDFEELNSIWRSACRFYNQTIMKDPQYVSPDSYQGDNTDQSGADLPEPVLLSSIIDPPAKPPELISGVLRQGHKMLISGPSKAGKSFLLMELAIAIAQGDSWMGFGCRQGKVLYINLEIDPASCIDRFLKIYQTKDYPVRNSDNILIWNLRGHALPLNKLAPILIDKMLKEDIVAVIVDPIYKVITGDENNATEMGAFCNHFDAICTALNASVIYCHHHSKGTQGGKKAMDRASGSGVFSRDPDALLDIIALKKPASEEEMSEDIEDDADDFDEDGERTAWQMEASLREFPPVPNIKFFFDYPVHEIDSEGILKNYEAEGSKEANLAASSKRTSKIQRKKRLDTAYTQLSQNGAIVTIADLALAADVADTTIRRYLKEFSEEYETRNGVVVWREILRNSAQNPQNSGE